MAVALIRRPALRSPLLKRRHHATIASVGLLVAMTSFLPACSSNVERGKPASQATPSTTSEKVQIAKVPSTATTVGRSPSAIASRKNITRQVSGGKREINAGSPSASPSSSSAASSAPDPSGQSVPIGNLQGWRQIFYDDFQGETLSAGQFSGCGSSTYVCSGLPSSMQSKWWDYPDDWLDSNKVCEYEPSQTISVSGDIMNMFIHTVADGTCMTAAPVPRLPDPVDSSNGQLYGMYSVRMKSDPVAGYKTAFLLWPDSENWPEDGEIDFPEGALDGTVDAYMHYKGATVGSQQDAYITDVSYTAWHTYTIEWTPDYVKFLLDGKVMGDSTDASLIPDTPMHWVMQTESGLDGGKPESGAQGNLQIAWAAIWSYDPSAN